MAVLTVLTVRFTSTLTSVISIPLIAKMLLLWPSGVSVLVIVHVKSSQSRAIRPSVSPTVPLARLAGESSLSTTYEPRKNGGAPAL